MTSPSDLPGLESLDDDAAPLDWLPPLADWPDLDDLIDALTAVSAPEPEPRHD